MSCVFNSALDNMQTSFGKRLPQQQIQTEFTEIRVVIGIRKSKMKKKHNAMAKRKSTNNNHRTRLTLPLFIKCLYQTKKVSDHIYLCQRYQFYFCLWILWYFGIIPSVVSFCDSFYASTLKKKSHTCITIQLNVIKIMSFSW